MKTSGVLFVMATALLSACSSATSNNQGPSTAEPQRPAWLADRLWHSRGNGMLGDIDGPNGYILNADGTGERNRSTLGIDGYPEAIRRPITWSSDGLTTLTIDSLRYDMLVTPNCKFIQLGGGWVYSATGGGECPFEVPALSEEEAGLVGSWDYQEREDNDFNTDAARGHMTLDANRTASIDISLRALAGEPSKRFEAEGYWTFDGEGALHVTRPDGTEVVVLNASKYRTRLSYCDERSRCYGFTK